MVNGTNLLSNILVIIIMGIIKMVKKKSSDIPIIPRKKNDLPS